MNDYILRQDAIIAMYKRFPLLQKQAVREAIKSAPSADVHENKKGNWLWETDPNKQHYGYLICSICGFSFIVDTKYCPNCGAKMKYD